MAATLQDVARLAGVNASTVSRVLNGKTVISSETKEKVYAAMQELDYHPNSLARSLASGQAGAIGVVLDASDEGAFRNAFYYSSQFAIEKVAQDQGYHVLIANGNPKAGNAVEKLLLERKVDALIMLPSTVRPSVMEKCNSFPYVLMGQPDQFDEDTVWVDIDNGYGASMAVEHLLSKGYKSIAYLGGAQDSDAGFIMRRQKGYLSALPEGAKPCMLATDSTAEDAYRVALACLSGEERPDAFLLNDNMAAVGLLRAAKELGLQVPEDIGAVTFNNYPMAEYTDPPLTAIDIDTELLGSVSAELLFERIKDPDIRAQKKLQPRLIERKSSQKS